MLSLLVRQAPLLAVAERVQKKRTKEQMAPKLRRPKMQRLQPRPEQASRARHLESSQLAAVTKWLQAGQAQEVSSRHGLPLHLLTMPCGLQQHRSVRKPSHKLQLL